MSDATIIDKLYDENSELVRYLTERSEISYLQLVEDSFRKALALSSASLFEHRITAAIETYCHRKASGDSCVIAIAKRSLKRQYHTFFNWEKHEMGQFSSLLGEMGDELKKRCKADPLKSSLTAFFEIGELRNKLVHQNYAGYAFEKTPAEVYQLYRNALSFVDEVCLLLDLGAPQQEEDTTNSLRNE